MSRTRLAGVSQVSRSNMCETGARHVRNTSETGARQLGVIYRWSTNGLPVISGSSLNYQKMVILICWHIPETSEKWNLGLFKGGFRPENEMAARWLK